jgi:hypothetical protein
MLEQEEEARGYVCMLVYLLVHGELLVVVERAIAM